MSRIRPGHDWGQRCPRWAGITSEVTVVGGARVHYLRAGREGNGPTHLLIHSMAAGAWSWMDVIGPLSEGGLVLAPDLPGSGRSRPRRRGGDAFTGAQFLVDFTTALGLERVTVHGHSMGGLVGGLFAGLAPHRVERLVLTSAPLPGLPDPPPVPAAWRVGLDVVRPVADVLVGTAIRLKAGSWRRSIEDGDSRRLGADVSSISSELLSLASEEIALLRLSWRAEGIVDAGLAIVRALTVDEARARAGLHSITAPVLLLWGADDRLIPKRLIVDVEAAHPDWSTRTIDGHGHLLPLESPETYLAVAG